MEKQRIVQAVEWGKAIASQSVAVSDAGTPHIAYIATDGSDSWVIHAFPTRGEWTKEIVWTSKGSDHGLMNTFMVLDGETVHLAFTYFSIDLMVSYLSTRTEEGWRTENLGAEISVIGMGFLGERLSIAVGNYTGIQLMTENDEGWDIETVLKYSEEAFPIEARAGFPINGSPKVSYVKPDGHLHIVNRTAEGWKDDPIWPLSWRNYDQMDLQMADDGSFFLYDQSSGSAKLLSYSEGGMIFRVLGDSISRPVKDPDGGYSFLEFSRRWGLNITTWRDKELESRNLFPYRFLSGRPYDEIGTGDRQLSELSLAFSREGIPHISYINGTDHHLLEYSTWSNEVVLNEPPSIGIEATPNVMIAPENMRISWTFAEDPDGEIVRKYILFQGSVATNSDLDEQLIHPGNYTAYAVAWDDDLSMTMTSIIVRVYPSTLTVRIEGEYSGYAPYNTIIRAVVSGGTGNISTVKWTPLCKGNFTTLDRYNYSCSFEEPGEHLIFVSVKDEHGSESIARITVSVSGKDGKGNDLSLAPIIALLMVPVLFSAAAMLAMGIPQGGEREQGTRSQERNRGRGSARGPIRGLSSPPPPRVRLDPKGWKRA
jgi:hypothetical protein